MKRTSVNTKSTSLKCCSHDGRGDKKFHLRADPFNNKTSSALDRQLDDISAEVEISFAAEDVTNWRVERYHQLSADRSQMSRPVEVFGGNDQLGASFCSSQTHSTLICHHRLFRGRIHKVDC